VLMTERFAAEILGILVGSIGLVLAVPLTTAVGVAVVRASGAGRRPVRITSRGRTTDGAAIEQAPAAKEATNEPAAPLPIPRQPREPMTADLPRTGRPPQPVASNGGESAAPQSQGKHRWSRRDTEDDFGDFTYLHEPEEADPGPPRSRGRRAR